MMQGNLSTQIQKCRVIFVVDANTSCPWYAEKIKDKYPVN